MHFCSGSFLRLKCHLHPTTPPYSISFFFRNSIIIILELHGHVKFFFIRNQEKIKEKSLFPPSRSIYQTIFSSYTHFKSYPQFVDKLLITFFFFRFTCLPFLIFSWFFSVYNRFPQDIHNVNNFLSTKVIHIIHNFSFHIIPKRIVSLLQRVLSYYYVSFRHNYTYLTEIFPALSPFTSI